MNAKPNRSKYKTHEEWYAARLEASRRWKEKNKEQNRAKSREWYQKRTVDKSGYSVLMLQSAKRRCPDTDLDIEYLQSLPDRCAVTGKAFLYTNIYPGTFSNPMAPSIDRIDSKIGYYKGNIQLVLNCINKMKNDMNNEDFKRLWKELTWPAH